MKIIALFAALSVLATVAASAESIYDLKLKDIDGKDTTLAAYKGKVLLIVNVASLAGQNGGTATIIATTADPSSHAGLIGHPTPYGLAGFRRSVVPDGGGRAGFCYARHRIERPSVTGAARTRSSNGSFDGAKRTSMSAFSAMALAGSSIRPRPARMPVEGGDRDAAAAGMTPPDTSPKIGSQND